MPEYLYACIERMCTCVHMCMCLYVYMVTILACSCIDEFLCMMTAYIMITLNFTKSLSMHVAVYVPPHTTGALCIWLSSVNINSTIVPILYCI